jgi:hypothetical protein
MMFRIALTGLVFFLIINICPGQKNADDKINILFRGVVLDASSKTPLGSSQVIINRLKSVIAADDGTFSFYAGRRDTIVFSMLGYKPASLIVSDTLKGIEFLTGIYLESDTLLIGDVIIIPRVGNLKAEMMNPTVKTDPMTSNARANLTVAAYQARVGQNKLGDPNINYSVIRNTQKINAYEKGGIPADKIVGISPLLLLPVAYLLIHGLPEKPPPPKEQISTKDLQELNKKYQEYLRNKK